MGVAGPLLGHITDTHISANGKPTAILKHRSLEVLNDIIVQFREARVDCTLFGGDNIDNRLDGFADLDAFTSAASTLDNYVAIVGNHECESVRKGRVSKQIFADRVAGHGIEPGRYNFAKTVETVRVVGIDTTLEGTRGGHVSPSTMEFLAKEIQDAEEEHIVVLGHHPLHRPWEPHFLQSWDRDYLVANRDAVTTLLASCPKVRAYLCGHHHAARIQRIASRGYAGGFYHILTASPSAFPHSSRLLRFAPDGIHVSSIHPRISDLETEGREAVLLGRKARRYATLGSRRSFLKYVQGRSSDNTIILPYDEAPSAERSWGIAVEQRRTAV